MRKYLPYLLLGHFTTRVALCTPFIYLVSRSKILSAFHDWQHFFYFYIYFYIFFLQMNFCDELEMFFVVVDSAFEMYSRVFSGQYC